MFCCSDSQSALLGSSEHALTRRNHGTECYEKRSNFFSMYKEIGVPGEKPTNIVTASSNQTHIQLLTSWPDLWQVFTNWTNLLYHRGTVKYCYLINTWYQLNANGPEMFSNPAKGPWNSIPWEIRKRVYTPIFKTKVWHLGVLPQVKNKSDSGSYHNPIQFVL